jgi:hypothetical protein
LPGPDSSPKKPRQNFFPLCGKTPKTFSIVWKKSAFFSTPWKIQARLALGRAGMMPQSQPAIKGIRD